MIANSQKKMGHRPVSSFPSRNSFLTVKIKTYGYITVFWSCTVLLDFLTFCENTAWKVSKDGIFSGPYFPVFSANTEKCGPEKTPSLDTFHAVKVLFRIIKNKNLKEYQIKWRKEKQIS